MPSKKETVAIIAVSAALTAGVLGALEPSSAKHGHQQQPSSSQGLDDAGDQGAEATRVNGETAGDAQLGQKGIPSDPTPPDPDVKFWGEP